MKKVILFITLFSMISLFSYSKDPVKQWGQLQVKVINYAAKPETLLY